MQQTTTYLGLQHCWRYKSFKKIVDKGTTVEKNYYFDTDPTNILVPIRFGIPAHVLLVSVWLKKYKAAN